MSNADKSSIYISIFKRKGGEGLYTKIVDETNKKNYSGLFSELEEDEKPLLIFFVSMSNFFLLTNNRILMSDEGLFSSLRLAEVDEVRPALQEEMNDRITNKNKFTRLKIRIKNGKYFVCKLEQGDPYQGIYQVLHFIVNRKDA